MTTSQRVLVVDDEASDLSGMCSMLETAGFTVFRAESGSRAVAAFLERRADVVVTDLAMPGGDGLGLIRVLRGLRPDVGVVAVTGKGPDYQSAARTMGADVVLAKPVDPQELADAVSRSVGRAGDDDTV